MKVHARYGEEVHHSSQQHEHVPYLVTVEPNIEPAWEEPLRSFEDVNQHTREVQKQFQCHACRKWRRGGHWHDEVDVNNGKHSATDHERVHKHLVRLKFWCRPEAVKRTNKPNKPKDEDHCQVHPLETGFAGKRQEAHGNERTNHEARDAEIIQRVKAAANTFVVMRTKQVEYSAATQTRHA